MLAGRGHGTDLSGGAVPLGGVVLVLTRMDRILSIDAANRVAVMLAAAFDPEGILNPGKVLPDQGEGGPS